MRDGAEIDPRFEQVNSGAVAQAVWVDSFAFKRRQSLRSAFNVFSQDEACAEAGERIAMSTLFGVIWATRRRVRTPINVWGN
jgi:hypothetical protein